LRFIRAKKCILLLLLLLPVVNVSGQNKEIKIDEAIAIALQNNKEIKAYSLKVSEYKALIPSAVAIEKTNFAYGTDQNNIAENDFPLKVWGVSQNFDFPTLYGAEKKAKKIEHGIAEAELNIRTENLIKQVSLNYIELQAYNEKLRIFQFIDSLYTNIQRVATVRNLNGDISNLDLLHFRAKQQHFKNQLNEINYNLQNAMAKLKTLMGYDSSFLVSPEIQLLTLKDKNIESSPYFLWLKNQEALSSAKIGIEKNKLLPDISLNYFIGTNFYDNARYYHGFEIGIAVPLFFNAQKSKIKASEIGLSATQYFSEYEMELQKIKHQELFNTYQKHKNLIDYYKNQGFVLYNEIMRTAKLSFEKGEIDFLKFASGTETALQIRFDYIDHLVQYNTVILEINYLSK